MSRSDHSLPLPRNLVEAAGEQGRQAWLATLPIIIAKLAEQWSLTVGAPFQPGGQTAWVAPVRGAAGNEMVMKVGSQHPEALHEAEGLRAWAGRSAIRLDAAEDLSDAVGFLLEACRPGTPLAYRPEAEQDLVDYYNTVRPHRGIGRRTPAEVFAARPKARPSGPKEKIDPHFRVRKDKVDISGVITLRHIPGCITSPWVAGSSAPGPGPRR